MEGDREKFRRGQREQEALRQVRSEAAGEAFDPHVAESDEGGES